MWIQEVLWIDLSPEGPPTRLPGPSGPPHLLLPIALLALKLIFNLIPFKKGGGGSTQKCEMKKGELQKQARSLFDFLIAKAQNVTYRCEIPMNPMKY